MHGNEKDVRILPGAGIGMAELHNAKSASRKPEALIVSFIAKLNDETYAHHISPAFSKMIACFNSAIAFSRPSLGDMRPSSCSMLIAPS